MSKQFWHRNGSTVLAVLGGVGVVATAVLTAKTTVKACDILDEAEKEKGGELTKWEKIQVSAKSYAPAVLVGLGTIGCIAGATIMNRNQQASMASAYALVDQGFKKYKHKLVEMYGEETHRNVMDAIAIEKAEETYIHAEYLGTNCDLAAEEYSSEPCLFYEPFGERYFESTIEQVITAEYHLNRNYVLRGYSVLNELYEFLGLEPTDYGSEIGWAISDDGTFWIDFDHSKSTLKDGTPFYTIHMPFGPDLEWKEYY